MRDFEDTNVRAVYDGYPPDIRGPLMTLRALIFQVADETPGVGPLEETLKWGQPAYLPRRPKTGSTIRLDHAPKHGPRTIALFVHCQTTLIPTFRGLFGDRLSYEGKRAILINVDEEIPQALLADCISLALTYHLRKAPGGP